MKNKIIAMVLIITLAAGITACGKSRDAGMDTQAETTSEDGSEANSETDAGEDAEEENTAEKGGDVSDEISFTVIKNRMETEDVYTPDEGEPFPYAYVEYPALEIPDEMTESYPKLSDALELWSEERGEMAFETLADNWSMGVEMASGEYGYFYSSNYDDWNLTVMRADDSAVSCLLVGEAFYNGAHPSTWYDSFFIDTKTGEFLPLSDVITDMKALPQVICDNLENIADDYEFTDEDYADMLPTIEEQVSEGYLTWTMDDDRFSVYFGPYDLMYYAFGPIFANISYEDYPDLFNPDYLPAETKTPVDKRISYKDGETNVASADILREYAGGGMYSDDDVETFLIECPDWDVPYLADGIFDTMTSDLVTLREIGKESSDWLDSVQWSHDTGISLPASMYRSGGDYTEDGYRYRTDNTDYSSLQLEVFDADTGAYVGIYDFSEYMNTPVAGNEFTTLDIPYAKLVDGTLYVEIAHRTYSEDQPYTGYIVAVEADTGRLLWRSETLVANGHNFIVTSGVIICGYGFTAEDDYLYILSSESGAILDERKLKTAPDYFILDYIEPGKKGLFVLTYNTAYTYDLSFG